MQSRAPNWIGCGLFMEVWFAKKPIRPWLYRPLWVLRPWSRKEARVFDVAIDNLYGYWNSRTYDGHPVHAHKVKCNEPEEKYNDNTLLEEYIKASEWKVSESDQPMDIRKLHKFLCNHVVHTTHHCLFAKCTSSTRCHCLKYPRCTIKFMSFLHLRSVTMVIDKTIYAL